MSKRAICADPDSDIDALTAREYAGSTGVSGKTGKTDKSHTRQAGPMAVHARAHKVLIGGMTWHLELSAPISLEIGVDSR
jgi:hypothetical protein